MNVQPDTMDDPKEDYRKGAAYWDAHGETQPKQSKPMEWWDGYLDARLLDRLEHLWEKWGCP